MSMARKAEDWFRASILVVVGLIIIAALITSFAKDNPLFAYMIGGGGALGAILYGVKRIYYS